MSKIHNYFFSMSSDAYDAGWERIFKPAVTWMDNHDELIEGKQDNDALAVVESMRLTVEAIKAESEKK